MNNRSIAAANTAKENYNSLTQNVVGQNTLAAAMVRTPEGQDSRLKAVEIVADEAGADQDESGVGEEQVLMVDAAEGASEAGEGLFGGAAAGAVAGGPIAATAGLAAAGVAGSTEQQDEVRIPAVLGPPIEVASAQSEGVNVGPAEDGSVLLSAGKTDAAVLGSKETNVSVEKLSLLNPNAEIPAGVPVSLDPATQAVAIDLGPVAQTSVDLSVDSLINTVPQFAIGATSGNIELEQLIAADLPIGIAGTQLPVTDTLNQGLAQLDDALTPVTEGLQAAIGGVSGNANPLSQALTAVTDIPVLGDAAGQVLGAVQGGLPEGGLPIELPLDALPPLPQTGTPLDVVTTLGGASISSLASGELPAVDGLAATLIPI